MYSDDIEQKYKLLIKNSRDKFLQNVPLVVYLIMLIFTILFELVNVDFDLTIMIKPSFWLKTLFSYAIFISVFLVIFPYFTNMNMEKEKSLTIKQKSQEKSTFLLKHNLTKKYKDYTKEIMSKEEETFFKNLLNDCGSIDFKYMKYTLKDIKNDYKQEILNKYQFKLLRNIKKGKISFAKLNGDEIKFIGVYSIPTNKKYKNSQNTIIKDELRFKIIIMFVIGVFIELFLNALEDGLSGDIESKYTKLKIFTKIATTLFKYATATWFAYKTSDKVSNEKLRFMEQVILHTDNFIETLTKEDLTQENVMGVESEEENNDISPTIPTPQIPN